MCTRVFWNSLTNPLLVGRTMDWPETTEPKLVVFPRGRNRNGGMLGSEVVDAENPLTWTSVYGSLVTTIYGVGTIDGFNERGLSGHLLYLKATDLGTTNAQLPGLQMTLWLQYLLDLAASVDEALALIPAMRLIMVASHGFDATVHLALEDSTGDSAIVEFIDGQLTIHHDPQYFLMTNDPSYDEQLGMLAQQDFATPSLTLPIPGNVNAVDRFQRAAYYTALLPKPKDDREAVASLMSVMRNASVPFGAPYGDFGVYNTEYRTMVDLTNRRYFFELSTSPSLIWTDLDSFDLSIGAPLMLLDPYDTTLSGDVTAHYAPGEIGF